MQEANRCNGCQGKLKSKQSFQRARTLRSSRFWRRRKVKISAFQAGVERARHRLEARPSIASTAVTSKYSGNTHHKILMTSYRCSIIYIVCQKAPINKTKNWDLCRVHPICTSVSQVFCAWEHWLLSLHHHLCGGCLWSRWEAEIFTLQVKKSKRPGSPDEFCAPLLYISTHNNVSQGSKLWC